MTKSPILNAVAAGIYIVFVVLVMQIGQQITGDNESLLIPMTMLSLLVLSVSVMGYLFIFEPVSMYMDGNRKEAVDFFIKTIASFAVIVILFLLALFISS
jgi:hypothetical protein